MANMNETPSANRLHIGVFGKTNSGKSSFINAFTKQKVSIVADVAGTTTDPVYKPMEIHPLGPCVIIDTAGFDDVTEYLKSINDKLPLRDYYSKTTYFRLFIAEMFPESVPVTFPKLGFQCV